MLESFATPDTPISVDRSTQCQLSSRGAMRGQGTIRSSASDHDAATAAAPTLLILFCCLSAPHSIHEVLSYPSDTSCMDGDLEHDGMEAFDGRRQAGEAPATIARRRSPASQHDDFARRSARREGSSRILHFYWFFNRHLETAD